VVVAALGVLNTVVLMTRERAHDLGVFKAVGMTPRQAIAMVVTTVAATGKPSAGRQRPRAQCTCARGRAT
jgi:putative ABC transport system permease protein